MFRASVASLLALVAAACGPDQENTADRPRAVAAAEPPAPATPTPPAPAELRQTVEDLGRGFPGQAGIAVKDLESGWVTHWRGEDMFPQQSVMKIWLAAAVLDAVDRGELTLDRTVVLEPDDLSVFHQPIKAKVQDDGRHVATVAELLGLAISKSDNAATDALMRLMGGQDAVQKVIEAKGLSGIRVGPEERVLHTEIAGLTWRPEYASLGVFNEARDLVPPERREALISAYVRDPRDGATPVAIVQGLDALNEGRVIPVSEATRLVGWMEASQSGPRRLKGGVGVGWRVAHKTGTGPTRDDYAVGWNDVGYLIAPDGRTYAVAVMIGRTREGISRRLGLMADVARAVTAHWEQAYGPKPPVPLAPEPATTPAA